MQVDIDVSEEPDASVFRVTKLRPDRHITRRSGIKKNVANGVAEREEWINLDPYLETKQKVSQKRATKRRRLLSEKYPSWASKTYIVLRSVHHKYNCISGYIV
jgi:hypothetical protein